MTALGRKREARRRRRARKKGQMWAMTSAQLRKLRRARDTAQRLDPPEDYVSEAFLRWFHG